MAARSSYTWPVIVGIVGISLFLVVLPDSAKQWAPAFVRTPQIHYGLDLAGGTQLDFRISEQEIKDQIVKLEAKLADLQGKNASATDISNLQLQIQNMRDQQRNIVEAIRTVLERRINALGVSEAVITPSYIGEEKHLLVECPGMVDTQACIDTVGKTIALEFKEEYIDADDSYTAEVEARADRAYARITESGETLDIVGQDLSDELGIAWFNQVRYFRDDLPKGLEDLWSSPAGGRVYRREGTLMAPQRDADGEIREREVPGIFLTQVLKARTQTGKMVTDVQEALEVLGSTEADATYTEAEGVSLNGQDGGWMAAVQSMSPGEVKAVTLSDGSAQVLALRSKKDSSESMEASHILISYASAESADATVTRTKEEALALAQDLKGQLGNGASFEALARSNSDGPSAAQGGKLGTFGKGTMVPAFEQAAFALEQDTNSDIVETQFGYHIIHADKALSATPGTVDYYALEISGENAPARAEELLAYMQQGNVTTSQDAIVARTVFFSLLPTGWKDTALDGKHFQTATVTLQPGSNLPVVQIAFNEEGGKLFQALTKANINKRIAIFVGGQLVSAPVVQQEIIGGTAVITGTNNIEEARQLALDLNTGAIPAPIYLSGQRTVEATLGAAALETSLKAALFGILVLMVYMVLFYRLLGLLADIALACYALLFFAILKLPLLLFSSQYIVLSLAGMAGIILSIGMAVDANVLIFERMKEELRKGKLLSTAADIGFRRAWPSIRDGNVSTFITCGILFMVGTSIVRGFAITLGMGVLLSMFSAIVITRWIIKQVAKTPLGDRPELFGVRVK